MSTAESTAVEQWEVPADRQQAARDAYRRSVDAGEPLSAAELALRFDRSPRWAQERIAEVRADRKCTADTRNAGHVERSAANDTAAGHAAPAAGRNRTAAGAQRIDTLIVGVVALFAGRPAALTVPIRRMGNAS